MKSISKWFCKSKQKPMPEVIEKTIDEILEELEYQYPANLEFTENTINKCENLFHLLKLYKNAFRANVHPEYNLRGGRVSQEILDLIHKETVKSLQCSIKLLSIAETKEAYNLLGSHYFKTENSKEREMLRSILNIRWRKIIRERFNKLEQNSSKEIELYEQLYFDCKNDDPFILKIAAKLNLLFTN